MYLDPVHLELDPERYVSAGDIAEWLRISPQALDYWRASGKLKDTVKEGRTRLYRLGEVIDCDAKMRDARPAGRLVNGRKPTERRAA